MTVVALPDIIIDLNFTAGNILWVNLIYLCSLVAFCIPFAKIISQYGVKKCIKLSLMSLLISVLLSIFAVDQYMLLISRLIQGLTSASLSISIYIMIVEELPKKDVGSALGIVGSAGYVGMLIAPSFMGMITHLANWRIAFLILIPILALQLILLRKIKDEWYSEKKPIDNIGSLLYVVMMVLFVFGLESIDEYGSILIVISAVIFVMFVKYERGIENRIYNLSLIRNIHYIIGNYAAMIAYFSITIAITTLSFYLIYCLDFESYIIGFILMISPIIMVGMAPPAGRLSNRIDPRVISGTAMFLIGIAMLIFTYMDRYSIEMILLACTLQGIGTGLFSAPNNKYVLTLVDEKDLPDASSLLSTSKEFGKILSTSVFAVILSLVIGNMPLSADLELEIFLSIHIMMLICAILAFSASILLFYSKYKYKFESNPEIIKIFRELTPDWIKKRFSD